MDTKRNKDKTKRLRWSRGCLPAFSTQVRRFKPGQSRWIFTSVKILSMPSFGGEVALRHVKEPNNLRELLGC
jgi:hypothetical protein